MDFDNDPEGILKKRKDEDEDEDEDEDKDVIKGEMMVEE